MAWRERAFLHFRLLRYTTCAAAAPLSHTHFMVDYLVNSIGFSIEEAISASPKVTRLKSTENPDSVLNFLKECGLDKTQIKEIVSSDPAFLSLNPDETLKPKVKLLQDIGLSRSDLVKVVSGNRSVFQRGLDTHFIPAINYVKKLVGSDENVVKAISRAKILLSRSTENRMRPNVSLLQEYGLSDEKIGKLVVYSPRHLVQNPEWLEDILHRVEEELGIPRNAAMFSRGVYTLASVSKSTLEMKFAMFRSFGWSNSNILTLARNLPSSLGLSEGKIQKGLNFFMKELGYTPEYLSSHPKLLSLSLEKRVKPRYEILKILQEKKLHKRKISLYTVVSHTELKFAQDFVLRYKHELPADLYETCTNILGL